ncbi:MAG: hypothetical protein ING72_07970 [Methylobacterium sp.]|nr:hypothetical protein [Methylobacterium sp.]MCA3602307.1 hypothetical protein [Methylobacterium sp.]MCA3615975.1 hypothetical protein [Methylobacterium sp.]MCA4910265.1 hypothetical protein [Methylobacterium sp.]
MSSADIDVEASILLREQAFQVEIFQPLSVGNFHEATILRSGGLSQGRTFGKHEKEQKKNVATGTKKE